VPEDFLVGRVLARNMVDADTGEIIAKANDELTEALLKKLRAAGIKDIQCLYTNELDQGAYISQTLAQRRDGRRAGRPRGHLPHDAPRRAADRRRRAGPVPRLFYNEDTYDLSRVGRMKFNARVGRDEPEGR
jgi:DNA-directed RNA polymerase subunit beta